MTTKQKPLVLEFGLTAAIPPGSSCAWGARAIFESSDLENGKFDIPSGRSCLVGNADARNQLVHNLTKNNALRHAARGLEKQYPANNDPNTHYNVYDYDGYRIMARSYGGYIYLAAFPIPPA